jgi:hypothetical protein
MTLAYIHWRDACHNSDEIRIDDLGEAVALHACGFVVKETEETITLSLEHQDGADTTRLWLSIPRVNIVEMRTATIDKAFPAKRKRK